MSDIESVYSENELDISLEEFEDKVQDKIDEMDGLIDDEAAAILIAKDIKSSQTIQTVEEIGAESENIELEGKLININELKSFNQGDDDDSSGKVLNATFQDETGTIRVTFWHKVAKKVNASFDEQDAVEITGEATYNDYTEQIEVNAKSIAPTDVESLDASEPNPDIKDIEGSILNTISVTGTLLQKSATRTFERDEGSNGSVRNLVIGDTTGQIPVTLWDEKTALLDDIDTEESIKLTDLNVKSDDGAIELHSTSQTGLEELDTSLDYHPNTTPIEDCEIGDTTSLHGVINAIYEVNTFSKDDGTDGKVRNILISDDTDTIRVALWGEDAERDLSDGDSITLINAEIRDGWQNNKEANTSWDSYILHNVADTTPQPTSDTSDTTSASNSGKAKSLDHFQNNSDSEDAGESGPQQDADSTDDNDERDAEDESGKIEITGTVINADSNQFTIENIETEATVKIPEQEPPNLGQQITVRGTKEDDVVKPTEIL